MKTLTLTLILLLVMVAPSGAQKVMSYDDYAAVLSERVDDDGLVDYAGLQASPERLTAFVESLARLARADYEAWASAEKIAFWINAYNGLTLKLIIDHYPITPQTLKKLIYPANSIRHIPGAWDKITFDFMGESLTLNHIEHTILRGNFEEPRIHMALVCAAVSCPPLRAEPYRGASLDTQLEEQTQIFLSDSSRLNIDRENGVVRVSAIFDWFAGDFVGQYNVKGDRFDEGLRAVIGFIVRHVNDADRRYLEEGEFDVKHFDYDWTLNEQMP